MLFTYVRGVGGGGGGGKKKKCNVMIPELWPSLARGAHPSLCNNQTALIYSTYQKKTF